MHQVKWGDHVVLVVHLPEGPFIADVGLGEGPRWPFKVENASWTEDRAAMGDEIVE
jgi:arylamine N-acetyltransferase